MATENSTTGTSASVRIDADTRARLEALRKRLLDRSSRAADTKVRRSGIPLGSVVEMGLRALERDLDQAAGVPSNPTAGKADVQDRGPDHMTRISLAEEQTA